MIISRKKQTVTLGCFIIFKRQSGNDNRGDKIAAIYQQAKPTQ
jgi:hypothetical protein